MEYSKYKWSVGEWIKCIAEYVVFSLTIAILFYNSVLCAVVTSPLFLVWIYVFNKQLIQRRKETIKIEFKEMMTCLAASLQAGISVEHAFDTMEQELRRAFPKGTCILADECAVIRRKIQMGQTVSSILLELGEQSNIDEIKDFASVFDIAKKTGGNLVDIIRSACEQMKETMDMKQDISIVVASKRLEHLIMLCVPAGMIGFLRITNQGYLAIMYTSLLGRAVMTISLFVIGVSYVIGNRILKII